LRSPASLTLKKRILRAGGWTLAGYFVSQIIRLGSNLVMTRLLAPEMFGIMAIATMVIHALNLFSDLGLRQSIVSSNRGHTAPFLNTVWTVQIVRGLIICSGCLGLSYAVLYGQSNGLFGRESTFSDPVLPGILAAVSINAVISGFESTKLLTASRNLSLGRMTVVDLTSQVIGLSAMIIHALQFPSIWALVTGAIISALARTALSHIAITGPSNNLHWNADCFREIFHFGKWIFISSVLGALLASGDRLLLGGIVSAETLGLYSIAFLIVNTAKTVFQKLMAFVIYPALSETARLQPQLLPEQYYRFRLPIDLVCLFSLGFLTIAAQELIQTLYDDRYKVAGDHLAVLSWTLFAARFGVSAQFYLAIGKPKLLTALTIAGVIFLYISVPLAFYYYGFWGALWAIAINPSLIIPLIFYFNYKNGILNLRKELLLHIGLPIGIGAGLLFELIHQSLNS